MSDKQLEEWCLDNLNTEGVATCETCPHAQRCEAYLERHKQAPFWVELQKGEQIMYDMREYDNRYDNRDYRDYRDYDNRDSYNMRYYNKEDYRDYR